MKRRASVTGSTQRRAVAALFLGALVGLTQAVDAEEPGAAPPLASIGASSTDRPSRPFPHREATDGRATGSGSFAATGMLVAILAALGGGAWFARRRWPVALAGSPGASMEVVGRAALSPRQGVVLLRVGSSLLVLGVGSQGPPSLIAQLPSETVEEPPHVA